MSQMVFIFVAVFSVVLVVLITSLVVTFAGSAKIYNIIKANYADLFEKIDASGYNTFMAARFLQSNVLNEDEHVYRLKKIVSISRKICLVSILAVFCLFVLMGIFAVAFANKG